MVLIEFKSDISKYNQRDREGIKQVIDLFKDGVTGFDDYSELVKEIYRKMEEHKITSISAYEGILKFLLNVCPDKTYQLFLDSISDLSKRNWSYIFNQNTDLKSITLPDNLVDIPSYVFAGCTKLKSITLPKHLKSVGYNAFYKCNELEKININNLKTWCNINFYNGYANPIWYAKELYINNKLLSKLKFPKGISQVPAYGFFHLKDLTEAQIPEGTIRIREYAFCQCFNLEKIEIPATLVGISSSALWRCDKLKTIIFDGTIVQWKNVKKAKDWSDYNTNDITIKCIDGEIIE